MLLRAIILAVLALVLLAGPFGLRPAFAQADNEAAPSAVRSEAEANGRQSDRPSYILGRGREAEASGEG